MRIRPINEQDEIIEEIIEEEEVRQAPPQVNIITTPQAPPPAQPTNPNQIIFKPTNLDAPKGIEQAMDVANKVTGEAFGQAMMYTVKTDEDMQRQLLTTAKQVIKDKTESIADMAETERKEKFFDKNADACNYFGYEEKTTAKFHVKAMAFWAFVLNSIYIFTIGYFVVAPITFILTKIKVVVKKTWLAFVLALIVYLLVIGVPVLLAWLGSAKAKIGV